mgnify:CR=1 FL=1|jgi:hypothetical protein
MVQVNMGDSVNIYYEDGTIEKNIAVTGWLVSKLNKDKPTLAGQRIIKIEVVESNNNG